MPKLRRNHNHPLQEMQKIRTLIQMSKMWIHRAIADIYEALSSFSKNHYVLVAHGGQFEPDSQNNQSI